MSDKPKDNPGPARPITAAECFQRHEKIDRALWGADGLGGIVKDIGDIKNNISALLAREAEAKTEAKTKGRDLRQFWFALLGSVTVGLVMAAVNYFLAHLH